MVSLQEMLTKFRPNDNYDYADGHFMTRVPPGNRMAYLHIIFDPADEDTQKEIIDPIQLPEALRHFYRHYNGAHLFQDSMSICGFFPRVHQYDRTDFRRSYPYNVMHSNTQCGNDPLRSKIFIFGSYGYDRSRLYIEKDGGLVRCSVADDLSRLRHTWPSFEVWLKEEIARMCDFFDEEGNQLVEHEDVLPDPLH